MPMITEVNDNINKAFPWVFCLFLQLIHMVIYTLSAVVHITGKVSQMWERQPSNQCFLPWCLTQVSPCQAE